MYERLKGRIIQIDCTTGKEQYDPGGGHFDLSDTKSAVKGLIEYHEDTIEILIEDLKKSITDNWIEKDLLEIKKEYKLIMIIQHWFEDAI